MTDKFHCILRIAASIELQCIKRFNNDEFHKVKQIEEEFDMKKIIRIFPEVFDNKVGLLKGTYHMKINTEIDSVKHAQRTVSVPLWEKVKKKLQELDVQGIITKVMEPTEWKENSRHLNPNKVKLRQKEINYIGHTAKTQGIKVGEGKGEAIHKMQTPKDVTRVKQILGMCQYLTKFLTTFSDKTKALRKMRKKTVFSCDFSKFHKYIYGKQDIKLDSDHKSLERIFQKEQNDISLLM